MEIFRTYAFQVMPLRTVSNRAKPLGGQFKASPELCHLFNDLVRSSKLELKSLVDLLSDDEEEAPFRSGIRARFLSVCFDDTRKANASAKEIAAKLSLSMDNRSARQSLLVIVTYGDGKTRRAVLWLFPKEDVFRLESAKGQPDLQLLKDVFSKSSTWRKAATFSGGNNVNGFRSGRVIDVQSGKSDDTAADFWIRLFLNARYAMDSKNATNQLAGYMRDAFESSVGAQREQMYAAIVAIPRAPAQSWTYQEIAERFLDKSCRSSFLNLIPVELRESAFQLDNEVFESKLNTRVFETVEGVWVSAPLTEIDASVKVVESKKQISFKGTIKTEEVRSRHVK